MLKQNNVKLLLNTGHDNCQKHVDCHFDSMSDQILTWFYFLLLCLYGEVHDGRIIRVYIFILQMFADLYNFPDTSIYLTLQITSSWLMSLLQNPQ